MAPLLKRGPGRPREFDGTVSVRLTAAMHDELARAAQRDRCDLAEVIRKRLSVSQNSTIPKNPAESNQ